MQIWTPTLEPRQDGEFAVRLNPGNGEPFAFIALSEDRELALIMQNPAECDRLIRAAVKAKGDLLGATSDPARIPLDIVPDSDDTGTDAS